jgi:hypothetical protein
MEGLVVQASYLNQAVIVFSVRYVAIGRARKLHLAVIVGVRW